MRTLAVFWFIVQIYAVSWVVSGVLSERLCHNSRVVNHLIISRSTGWIPACWSPFKLNAGQPNKESHKWAVQLNSLKASDELSPNFSMTNPINIYIDEWREQISEVHPQWVYLSKDQFFDQLELTRTVIEAMYLQSQGLDSSILWSRIYSIFHLRNLYDVGIRKDYPHQWEWTVSQWLMDYQNQLSWGDRRDFHRSLFRLDPLRLSLTLATLKKESEVKKIDVNHALSKVLNIHLSKLNQPMTFKMRSELFTEVDERKTDIKAFTKSGKSPYRKLYGVLQVCEWPTVNKVLGEKSHVPNILYVKHCGKALFNSGIYSKKEVNAFLTKFSKLPFISFHRGSLKLFVKLKTIPLEKKYSPYEWKKILESTSISYDTKLMAHHPLSAIEVVPFYRVN